MQLTYARLPHISSSAISFSSNGTNTIITPSTGFRINVHRIWFVVAGATSVTFMNGAVALSGAVPMVANQALVFDITGEPWFTTSASATFIINSTNAVQVSGMVYYSYNQ